MKRPAGHRASSVVTGTLRRRTAGCSSRISSGLTFRHCGQPRKCSPSSSWILEPRVMIIAPFVRTRRPCLHDSYHDQGRSCEQDRSLAVTSKT